MPTSADLLTTGISSTNPTLDTTYVQLVARNENRVNGVLIQNKHATLDMFVQVASSAPANNNSAFKLEFVAAGSPINFILLKTNGAIFAASTTSFVAGNAAIFES